MVAMAATVPMPLRLGTKSYLFLAGPSMLIPRFQRHGLHPLLQKHQSVLFESHCYLLVLKNFFLVVPINFSGVRSWNQIEK